jgi:hypothetical protein
MGFDLTAATAYVEENADEFFSRSVLGAKVAQTMTKVTGIKSSIKLPTLDMGYDLFQDDNDCSFDDGGNDLVIAQRELAVSDIKINEKFCIKDLEPFFTQKILTPGSEYTAVPNELRLMEIVVERVQKAVELTAVRGVLSGSFADASFNLFDGMLETISNDIAASDIPAGQQLSGALTAGNIIASFRAMYDALPVDNLLSTVTDGDWVIYCSPLAKALYNRDFQSTNGALPYNQAFNQDFLDNTGIEIIALAGMANDDTQAILTRKGNFWQGSDIDGEETDLKFHFGTGSEYRDLFLTGEFKLGYQTKFPDEMVVNNIS